MIQVSLENSCIIKRGLDLELENLGSNWSWRLISSQALVSYVISKSHDFGIILERERVLLNSLTWAYMEADS